MRILLADDHDRLAPFLGMLTEWRAVVNSLRTRWGRRVFATIVFRRERFLKGKSTRVLALMLY